MQRDVILEPLVPKLCLVSRAKVNPVLHAMTLTRIARIPKNRLPRMVVSMISLNVSPAASPPLAIMLVIRKTYPVHTMVMLLKLLRLSIGTSLSS